MKKIIISLAMIAAVGAIAIGATTAFFSDTESSTGNTFTAGAIDLTVSSQASYNGATASYGDWTLNNLTGELFFNLADIKPEDWGENTIGLNVNNNPAWVCATVTITDDDDISCTEPESTDDTDCSTTLGVFNGEMRENLAFAWWPDLNHNNILDFGFENDHKFFLAGKKLSDMLAMSSTPNTLNLTLADSLQNFFTGTANTPLSGNTLYSVGTAWCMGDMAIDTNGVISCDGAPVNNESQSDSLKAAMTFTASQERNQLDFRCPDTFKQ